MTHDERAQRWHDTDHGAERGLTSIAEAERPVSSCWCCCETCDPDRNPARPNPFWIALKEKEQ